MPQNLILPDTDKLKELTSLLRVAENELFVLPVTVSKTDDDKEPTAEDISRAHTKAIEASKAAMIIVNEVLHGTMAADDEYDSDLSDVPRHPGYPGLWSILAEKLSKQKFEYNYVFINELHDMVWHELHRMPSPTTAPERHARGAILRIIYQFIAVVFKDSTELGTLMERWRRRNNLPIAPHVMV